jgi:taurine dioxygenase
LSKAERPRRKGGRRIAVRPLTGALGVEATRVDLTRLTSEDLADIKRLLLDHLVVVFPDQRLDPSAQVALGRRFGALQVHAYHANPADPHPEILVIEGAQPVADFWHTDETFELRPPAWSILRMVQCPVTGGDTLWSNQCLAYEALSPPIRAALEGLSARHVTPDGDASAVHPVVLRHPDSGRPSLYVNRHFTREILGISALESDALLRLLFEVSEQPDFQCRYRWTPEAVAIWDNRCTQHRVVGDYRGWRRIERVAVEAR